jgi:hypothetical protein
MEESTSSVATCGKRWFPTVCIDTSSENVWHPTKESSDSFVLRIITVTTRSIARAAGTIYPHAKLRDVMMVIMPTDWIMFLPAPASKYVQTSASVYFTRHDMRHGKKDTPGHLRDPNSIKAFDENQRFI